MPMVCCGEVAEWLKAPLSKSGILAKTGIVGSNPTLSASPRRMRAVAGRRRLSCLAAAVGGRATARRSRRDTRRDDRVG